MKTMNLLISVSLFTIALFLNAQAVSPALRVTTYLLGGASIFAGTTKFLTRYPK